MIADYYSHGFELKEHYYGEDILVTPETALFVPARVNLRAIIEADRGIKTLQFASYCENDREVPALFWDENLSFSDENTYVFETKYCEEGEGILPVTHIGLIPEKIKRGFTRPVPDGISQLASKLIGKEDSTRRILRKFFDFIHEHQRTRRTTGEPIEQLLDEYEKTGYFYGNCKEVRDFYIALCDSQGYPTKKVLGKALDVGGHVWVDVFVPVESGYKLLPIDSALGYFGNLSPIDHLFFEYTPIIMPIGIISRIRNFVRRKDAEKDYKLRIERIE